MVPVLLLPSNEGLTPTRRTWHCGCEVARNGGVRRELVCERLSRILMGGYLWFPLFALIPTRNFI